MNSTINTSAVHQLHISDAFRQELITFIGQILEFYKQDLLSVTAFGSVVSGDYFEKISDINLLVVYSDLNIASLADVAAIAQKGLRQRLIAPRFISRRNLLDSAPYFQIDMLEMRDANKVLYGENLLSGIAIDRKALLWQLSFEIKSMRMRIKQQFWRSSGHLQRSQTILLERFTSLAHLIRALLFLMSLNPPVSLAKVMDLAVTALNIDRDFVSRMFSLKKQGGQLNDQEIIKAFSDIMDAIRIVDAKSSGLSL
jgi:predicted nucleotidyltransferase